MERLLSIEGLNNSTEEKVPIMEKQHNNDINNTADDLLEQREESRPNTHSNSDEEMSVPQVIQGDTSEVSDKSLELAKNINLLDMFHVNSTVKTCEKKITLDFSILKGLSGENHYPPYLRKETTFENIGTAVNVDMAVNPLDYGEHQTLTLQARKTILNVERNFLGQAHGVVSTKKSYGSLTNDNRETKASSFSNNKIIAHPTEHFPLAIHDPPSVMISTTNNFDNIDQFKTGASTSTTTDLSVPVQSNQSNSISTFTSGSLRPVFLADDILNTLQSNRIINFTQSDQIVPSTFMNGEMQNVFIMNNDRTITTTTQKTKGKENPNLLFQKFSSFEINKNISSDKIDSLNRGFYTDDCDDEISLEFLPMFTMMRKKTVEESIRVYPNHNIQLLCELQANKEVKSVKKSTVENFISVCAMDIKTPLHIPTFPKPILSKSDISEQSETSNHCNEERELNVCDYNDLFDISNSSWSDIEKMRENVAVAEKTLNNVLEEESIIKPQSLNTVSDEFNDDDDDDLYQVIDDSIKKYENFTRDASVSATPSTVDKSCQTEILVDPHKLDVCKRCLAFEERTSESLKKKKLNLNNEGNFEFSITVRNNLDDSSAPPSVKERELDNFNPISKDHCATYPSKRYPGFDSMKSNDDDDQSREESLFDLEDNEQYEIVCANNSSTNDSDQEVPINQQANEDWDFGFGWGDDELEDVYWSDGECEDWEDGETTLTWSGNEYDEAGFGWSDDELEDVDWETSSEKDVYWSDSDWEDNETSPTSSETDYDEDLEEKSNSRKL